MCNICIEQGISAFFLNTVVNALKGVFEKKVV